PCATWKVPSPEPSSTTTSCWTHGCRSTRWRTCPRVGASLKAGTITARFASTLLQLAIRGKFAGPHPDPPPQAGEGNAPDPPQAGEGNAPDPTQAGEGNAPDPTQAGEGESNSGHHRFGHRVPLSSGHREPCTPQPRDGHLRTLALGDTGLPIHRPARLQRGAEHRGRHR